MKDIGPKLRVYFKTKGYTDLSFYKWDTIEKLFNLLWENSTYSITIDYSYICSNPLVLYDIIQNISDIFETNKKYWMNSITEAR
jgi:hypothetical protein